VTGAGGRGDLRRRHPFGPSVAALVLTMLVYSFASWLALDGVPDSESGLFVVMGAVLGLPMAGVTVASPVLLLVARVAGLGMLASLGAVAVTRMRMTRSARRA
jgi:hypothetical protein